MTAAMLGVDPFAVRKDDILDGLGELASIVTGNIKSLLPQPCHAGLPHLAVRQSEVVSALQAIAAGSEEMGVSIQEIAANANAAAWVAGQAVVMARSTNDTITKLGESSAEIGNVIKVSEMSRNVTAAASGSNEIAANIARVAAASEATTAGIAQASESAGQLTGLAGDLRQPVHAFRV